MKYCSHCGSDVQQKIPEGDNRLRYICDACDTIHYHNPKIVTGCIPQWEDKILLCKRAIEPRLGLWTLPAGFMENNETTAESAMRETLEEAHSRVEIIKLYAMFDIPHISQVYIMYHARMLDLDFKPGIESLEVELLTEDQIPWDKLAFPVVTETLKRFYSDKETGATLPHLDTIHPTHSNSNGH